MYLRPKPFSASLQVSLCLFFYCLCDTSAKSTASAPQPQQGSLRKAKPSRITLFLSKRTGKGHLAPGCFLQEQQELRRWKKEQNLANIE